MDVKLPGFRVFGYLVYLLALTLLIGCSDSNSSDEIACADDTDCSVGQQCIQGICQTEAFCTTNVDCDGGFYCKEYSCVPADPCAEDQSCPDGFVCTGGYCMPDQDNPQLCQSDEDCGSGKRCDENGSCVDANSDGDAEADAATDGDLGGDDDLTVDGDKPSDGDSDGDSDNDMPIDGDEETDSTIDGDLPVDGDFTGDEDIATDGDTESDLPVDGDLEIEIAPDGDAYEVDQDDEIPGDGDLELSELAESESIEDGDLEVETENEIEIDIEADMPADGDEEADSDQIEAEEEALFCDVQGCTSGSESRAGCAHARTIGRRDAAFNEYGYSVPYGDLCGESNHFDGIPGQTCSGAGPDHAYRLFMRQGETAHIHLDPYYECSGSDDLHVTFTVWSGSNCLETACETSLLCENNIYYRTYTPDFVAPYDGWFVFVVDATNSSAGDYVFRLKLSCNQQDCECP